jgi:hypothetical protein
MIEAPDLVDARNSVQINAPGSVTLKNPGVWHRDHSNFGFEAARRQAWKHERRSHRQCASDLFVFPRKQCGYFEPSTRTIGCCSD